MRVYAPGLPEISGVSLSPPKHDRPTGHDGTGNYCFVYLLDLYVT